MGNIVTVQNNTVAAVPFNDTLLSRWVSYIDAAPKTVDTYRKAVKQFFVYILENGIAQPQRDDVIAYRDQLKQNHKPTTVQNYLSALKIFFQWAEQEGIYPNIADHVKGAKIDKGHKKDYLTTRQVSQVLNSIDRTTPRGKRDYAIVSLMLTTGLRTVSIIQANREDIRTAGDSIVLYYQGKGHEEKADYVKIAAPVEDAIRDYLTTRGTTDSTAPLFTSEANRNSGGRMTTRSISRLVKDHLVAAGLDSDRLTAHSLRHTAATLNLLNGGTLAETQQLLGHTNINTTMIYSHALEREHNQSENRIAQAIFG